MSERSIEDVLDYLGALGVRAIVLHTDKAPVDVPERWRNEEAAGRLRRRATVGPAIVYDVPHVRTARALDGRLLLPDRLTAASSARVALELRPTEALPWVPGIPHGRRVARVSWVPVGGGAPTEIRRDLAMPLVVPPAGTIVPVSISVPATPGRYLVDVGLPGWSVRDGPVSVGHDAAPSSRDAPALLAATYIHTGGAAGRVVRTGDPMSMETEAVNAGRAVWLSEARRDQGVVALGWRWFGAQRELRELAGTQRVPHDVFAGQAHRFRYQLSAPSVPGRYVLEIGLVSQHVTWFVDVGSAPLRIPVTVEAAARGTMNRMMARLIAPGQGLVSLHVSTTCAAMSCEARWTPETMPERAVDTYVILEKPDGSIWFRDAARLSVAEGAWWPPLRLGGRLGGTSTQSTVIVDAATGDVDGDLYRVWVVVTEPDTYQVVARGATPRSAWCPEPRRRRRAFMRRAASPYLPCEALWRARSGTRQVGPWTIVKPVRRRPGRARDVARR